MPSSGNAAAIAVKKKFSVGPNSTCVLRDEGFPVCWGYDWINTFGIVVGRMQADVGDSSSELGGALNRTAPFRADGSAYIRANAIFAGGDMTCQLDAASVLRCTGVNWVAQPSLVSGTKRSTRHRLLTSGQGELQSTLQWAVT
jgi:hypothetical protein